MVDNPMPPKSTRKGGTTPSIVKRPFKHQEPLCFDGARERMARFIRDGGLALPKEWAQVNQESFAPLADINTEGMLTMDSQDAIGNTPVQRAYVEGIMPPDAAAAYVNWINLNTNIVALPTTIIYSDDIRVLKAGDDAMAVAGVAVTRERRGRGRWNFTTTISPFETRTWEEAATEMRSWGGLLPNKDFVFVNTFDPIWGRSALAEDGLFATVIRALRASR